ncbi:hypothetical protein LTR08_006967 [Meristemomyces frigidus]|nr:hypothetical protein LTR08_006967 [Meristemomyces frigidus]
MSTAGSNRALGAKMGDWFRHVLSCCDRDDEDEDDRPALQISSPTDFRREDISMPGLDAESQRWIREKARLDAGRMYDHLQPLRSSPSADFASKTTATTTTTTSPRDARATLPSYEHFTTPRAAPSPLREEHAFVLPPIVSVTGRRVSEGQGQGGAVMDRVKAHGRKISATLMGGGMGWQGVAGQGQPYEMRALMDSRGGEEGKGSGESFSARGSEGDGDRDSAKGGLGVRV